MTRNSNYLVIIGFCGCVFGGCMTTGSDSESLGPTAISYPAADSGPKNLHPQEWPFYEYDSAIIKSVEKRWYDLLSTKYFRTNKTGKVVVWFRLNSDGSVSAVKILENQAGYLLGVVCERAVVTSSPFNRWPSGMKEMVGSDYREVTFTFYYK